MCVLGAGRGLSSTLSVISYDCFFKDFFKIMWGSRCVHLRPGVLRAEWRWIFLGLELQKQHGH